MNVVCVCVCVCVCVRVCDFLRVVSTAHSKQKRATHTEYTECRRRKNRF
jgi:hypothetical protein